MNPNKKHLTADAVAEAACFTVVLSWPAAGVSHAAIPHFQAGPELGGKSRLERVVS
jgi:hypothetical protein